MKRVILFRIASDPVARVCSGVNPIIIPADSVEDDEARYLGGGALLDIPELEQLINGSASRLAVSVSGVNPATLALALAEAPSVKGAAVHIGIAHQDDAWQITEVEWLTELRADSLTVDRSSDGSTRTITLSIASDDTDRSKAPLAFFTDADQRRRSPTDAIFDHVAGINAGTSRKFGPK